MNRIIGINISINLGKIPKSKMTKSKDGSTVYLNCKSFMMLDELQKFGDNGLVLPQGEKGEDLPIVGNVGIFYASGIDDVKLANRNKKEKEVEKEVDSIEDIF